MFIPLMKFLTFSSSKKSRHTSARDYYAEKKEYAECESDEGVPRIYHRVTARDNMRTHACKYALQLNMGVHVQACVCTTCV